MWPRHLDFLSLELATAAMTPGARIMVHAPPRHGKSDLISKWFPLWCLEHWPHKRVILCAYSDTFASRWGRRVRNEAAEYKDQLTVRISQDSKANDDWETTEGGGMKTAGVGGPITGRGGDIMIVDDPIKNWEEAGSSNRRDTVGDWWDTTFLTRLEPGGIVVLDMTRWHEDDLAGRIIESTEGKDWKVINLLAEAEEGDILGRAVGDPLWPERYGREDLAKVKRRSNYVWESMYQQRPPSLLGNPVYAMYSDDLNKDHGVHLRDDLPLHLSLDFNINPGMHAVLGQWDEDRDEAWARHVIHEPRMTINRCLLACFEIIRQKYGGFRWPHLEVFGDPTGRSEWVGTGKSAWDVVREFLDNQKVPYRLRVQSNSPGVFDRVVRMNAALLDADGNPHYFVHPECEILIRDFKQLKWEGDEIGKKDRKLSHPSDAEGYRIHRLRPLHKIEQRVGTVGTASGVRYG